MKLEINLDLFKSDIEPIVKKYDLLIYEINTLTDFGSKILQILLEQKNNNPIVPLNLLAKINEEISILLDTYKNLNDSYFLEVASVGIEKQIKSQDELNKCVGKYLNLKSKKMNFEKNVTLISINGDEYNFEYNDKGIKKKLIIEYKNINFIRFAIKF